MSENTELGLNAHLVDLDQDLDLDLDQDLIRSNKMKYPAAAFALTPL